MTIIIGFPPSAYKYATTANIPNHDWWFCHENKSTHWLENILVKWSITVVFTHDASLMDNFSTIKATVEKYHRIGRIDHVEYLTN